MQLFGLEGSGFVLSLGITLLLSGAIMFYVLKRFSYIEASIIQNAKILQSFISEMENNKFGANETAIQSAKFQAEKIYVSDNDLTESESDSDADSDTDSNADSNADADSDADADADAHTDADAGAVPHADVDSELHGNHGTGSDIQEIENSDIKLISIENSLANTVEEVNLDLEKEYDDSASNDSIENSSLLFNNNDTKINVQKEEKQEKPENIQVIKKSNLIKMKVPELKELLLKNNKKLTQDNVNKLKKDELIKELQVIL
tara:strand:+ start:29559 stop:30344 length:786 start_codon:yes stop_codon:yes gene_type:complete